MNNRNIFLVIAIIVIPLFQFSAKGQHSTNKPKADTLVNFTVTPVDEWTNLFYRNEGWFGADGIFTVPLDGIESLGASQNKKTLIYFSDTMTGTIKGDSIENFKMVNNSVAYIDGIIPSEETVEIMYKKDGLGNAQTYIVPSTPNTQPDDYYWMGDNFVNQEDNNSINIFGYRTIDHSEKSWDFEIVGVTLITLPEGAKPPFTEISQIDAPLMMDIEGVGKGTFGSGVYVNTAAAGAPKPDGYVYVYGLLDPNKQLVVARVKPATFKKFDTWRYWDGTGWNTDINKVAVITDRVSNELSLTPMKDGRYLLVFQSDGIGEHVAVRIADSPIGPFGPLQNIWRVPEVDEELSLIPYNAKAHYILSSEEDGLLISYNTISLDYFNDIRKYPHMYRPRFIRLKIEE